MERDTESSENAIYKIYPKKYKIAENPAIKLSFSPTLYIPREYSKDLLKTLNINNRVLEQAIRVSLIMSKEGEINPVLVLYFRNIINEKRKAKISVIKIGFPNNLDRNLFLPPERQLVLTDNNLWIPYKVLMKWTEYLKHDDDLESRKVLFRGKPHMRVDL